MGSASQQGSCQPGWCQALGSPFQVLRKFLAVPMITINWCGGGFSLWAVTTTALGAEFPAAEELPL